MRVFLTGATGFIGRALVLALHRQGYSVVAWVRSPGLARAQLGEEVELLPIDADESSLISTLSKCEAVINLAGEPIFGKRWTPARRKALVDSRVLLTARLVRALKQAEPPPAVLLSGSAVGYYGDRGEERLGEESSPSSDFLARLCQDWEQAAMQASSRKTRVVCLRTGIVLGHGGGALKQMALPFRFGLGGPLGSGSQFVPWIHLHDCIEMILATLEKPELSGPVNIVGPAPVKHRELARALGKAMRKPAFFRAPPAALRTLLGQAAESLCASQKCYPDKADAHGYRFRFQDIDEALRDLLGPGDVHIGTLRRINTQPLIDDPAYLKQRRPDTFLSTRTILDAPLDSVFRFFSKPGNLGLLTPPEMNFTIQRADALLKAGATIEYRLRVFGIPIGWRTRIECWEDKRHFVDSQTRGPYRAWWHEHRFSEQNGCTVMEDRVYYALPFRILGRVLNRLLVAQQLRTTFNYRAAAISFRFGSTPAEHRDQRK